MFIVLQFFDEFIEIPDETFEELWNVQTIGAEKCAIKVLLLLAVTLFNQIKLKRALNSVNYEDKSSD